MSDVAAITMVKDEADVIVGALRNMAAEGVDEIIVADNMSTDGTRQILEQLRSDADLGCRFMLLADGEVGYYQSRKMSWLAETAASHGAEWIVPFDADELWFGRDKVGDVLRAQPVDVDVVGASLWHHFPTAVDPGGDDPFRTIEWRQAKAAVLPKVAFRWRPGATIHAGNHGVDLPPDERTAGSMHYRRLAGWDDGGLMVRHFPYRSAEQMIRKARNGAAAYAATDLPADVGAHWRQYGTLLERGYDGKSGEEALADVFREYFWFLAPTEAGLVYDPAPYLRWR